MEKTMESNLIRFIHLLRMAGLRIGSGEVIDALNALSAVEPCGPSWLKEKEKKRSLTGPLTSSLPLWKKRKGASWNTR